jgi:hypothetical protein
MPVRWTIDHSLQLVEIAAEGPCGPDDFVKMLDAIEGEGAVPYRKLLDVSRVEGRMMGDQMPTIAERISRFRNPGPFVVVVAPGGPTDGLARLFVLLAEATGRARVFRVAAQAREWLDAQVSAE